MRRLVLIAAVTLLVLSLTANAVLGWATWTSQKEYRALAKQFVKAKQDLAAAQKAAATPSAAVAPAAAKAAPAVNAPAPAAASGPAPAVTEAAPGSGPTTEQIRAKYAPRLAAVQADCEGQLSSLLGSAKAEYNQAKSAGGTVDVAALGAKYMAKADGLRRQCDRQVDAVTAAMATDLRSAGLPLDLVAEVKETYESRIIERQAEIMAKAP